MAGEELTILLFVVGEGLEGNTTVAFLVALEMLGHVISHEGVEQVQLEVVLLIEVLALDCLRVCVVIVLVALVGEGVEKMLLALKTELHEDAFLEVHLDALNRADHLVESLGLDGPGCSRVLERVKRLSFLLLEEFGLSCHLLKYL